MNFKHKADCSQKLKNFSKRDHLSIKLKIKLSNPLVPTQQLYEIERSNLSDQENQQLQCRTMVMLLHVSKDFKFFSKTGFIKRPHRRLIGDDLAENLFFCKENLNFL